MPSPRNISQLADLKDKFSRAKSVVFADHSGLPVAKQQELKSGIRESGGEMSVAKNTLLKLALGESIKGIKSTKISSGKAFDTSDTSDTFDTFLIGPTSVLFSFQDEVLPIKVLAKFAAENEKPTIKAGIFAGKPLTADEVRELAALPGFDELLVKLMRQMQGPMYGMINVLGGNIRKLVYVLDARRT